MRRKIEGENGSIVNGCFGELFGLLVLFYSGSVSWTIGCWLVLSR